MAATILQKIVAQRHLDVVEAKRKTSLEEIKALAAASPFKQISFPARLLQQGNKVAVMAEVKRASPSKGDIAPNIVAAEQGLQYATAGAAAISCLTEPTWFKGTLEDMKNIRVAIDALPNRPALLRKDFVVDEYQIYEARVYGADTLLLIVAALTEAELTTYLLLARSLHMEPLVEVNTDAEMDTAIRLGARVIGINNRSLHNFVVDMDTTGRLIGQRAALLHDTIFAALSGISTRDDVEAFIKSGARAVLVGEALMRAPDPAAKVKELQGDYCPLVKICGLKEVEIAIATAEAGADFIGLVFAVNSKRKVSVETAKAITDAIKEWRAARFPKSADIPDDATLVFPDQETRKTLDPATWYNNWAWKVQQYAKYCRPLVVGVFADNPIDEVNSIAQQAGLDLIQLSGKEGFSASNAMCMPTIKAVHVGTQQAVEIETSFVPNTAICSLLDTADPTALGGTGRAFNWEVARAVAQHVAFFLAGGLTPSNVAEAISLVRPFALDVSSGVETDGVKDLAKIKDFLASAKKKL